MPVQVYTWIYDVQTDGHRIHLHDLSVAYYIEARPRNDGDVHYVLTVSGPDRVLADIPFPPCGRSLEQAQLECFAHYARTYAAKDECLTTMSVCRKVWCAVK